MKQSHKKNILKSFSCATLLTSLYFFYHTYQGGISWAKLHNYSQELIVQMNEATPKIGDHTPQMSTENFKELRFVWHSGVILYFCLGLLSFSLSIISFKLFKKTK